MPPSPVQPFRQWLKMAPADREKGLAEYPVDKREVLKRKLELYERLSPAERERRLQMLELRYYIQPLMTNSSAARSTTIGRIPKRFQKVVAERLREWDGLQPEAKQRILGNETAVNYFASLPPQPPLPTISESTPAEASIQLALWRDLNDGERAKLSHRFNEYFDWPKQRREQLLERLTEAEQQEMQKTLDAFERLTPNQRVLCINSFNKFTQMTPQERNLFLRNAARWSAMTPEERSTWKLLVNELPPLPPIDPPIPPIPEDMVSATNAPAGANPP
jgi:hypothetical protein